DRLGDRWAALWQPVARQQLHFGSVFERQQTDAVKLALEDPLRPGEALLRERCCHRRHPFGKGHFYMKHLVRSAIKRRPVQSAQRLASIAVVHGPCVGQSERQPRRRLNGTIAIMTDSPYRSPLMGDNSTPVWSSQYRKAPHKG